MMAKVLALVAAGGIVLGDVSVSMARSMVNKTTQNLKEKSKIRAVQKAFEERSAPQKPKSVLNDGVLGNSTGFSQGGPSATGTLSAPSSGRGGSGQVIK
jgi:hypothetical protein